MLSILIPIFNRKVVTLVDNLSTQCTILKIQYEIICIDDLSQKKYRIKNEIIRGKIGVNYIELSENIGRAKIRNWLAKLARYENLLFLDCDSKIMSKKYIKKYIEVISDYEIVYGGRSYSKVKPTSKDFQLHWKYGTKKESKIATKRSRNPYLEFMSNNFLIKAKHIKEIPFSEEVLGYGYEDLVLAQKAYLSGLLIKHIDNPLKHVGLEKSASFLRKNENAIKNLISLNQSNQIMETRLTRAIRLIKKVHLESLVKTMLYKFQPTIVKNLKSDQPSLLYLSLWKLHSYYSFSQK